MNRMKLFLPFFLCAMLFFFETTADSRTRKDEVEIKASYRLKIEARKLLSAEQVLVIASKIKPIVIGYHQKTQNGKPKVTFTGPRYVKEKLEHLDANTMFEQIKYVLDNQIDSLETPLKIKSNVTPIIIVKTDTLELIEKNLESIKKNAAGNVSGVTFLKIFFNQEKNETNIQYADVVSGQINGENITLFVSLWSEARTFYITIIPNSIEIKK